ncbi:hypothetical protein, partial [Streptococcus pneumoniae]|uniref:hypothetical protein n=1 Tax=Streptococcus pneumoniae TaxID=1313 RepID=UPI0018B0ABF5
SIGNTTVVQFAVKAVEQGAQVGEKKRPSDVAVHCVLLRPRTVVALVPPLFCKPCTALPLFHVAQMGLLRINDSMQFV